jgi:hypothetical protein
MSRCRAHPVVGQELRQPFLTQALRTGRISVPVRRLSAFARPVQVAQAPAKGFDLLLVRELLPLGQLQGFEHLFHILEGGAEGFDDMADLFNGPLDGSGRRGPRLARGWRGSFPLDSCRNLPLDWCGFRDRRSQLGRCLSRR